MSENVVIDKSVLAVISLATTATILLSRQSYKFALSKIPYILTARVFVCLHQTTRLRYILTHVIAASSLMSDLFTSGLITVCISVALTDKSPL